MAVTRDVGSDEINLIEIWQLLVRWKALVGAVFLLVIAGAGIYVKSAQAIYEAEFSLYIGQVADNKPLDVPTYLATRIQAEHGARNGAWVKKATPDRKDHRMILVKVESTSPQGAFQLATELSLGVAEAHQSKFQSWLDRTDAERAAIEALLSEGERQLALAEKASSNKDPGSLLTARMGLSTQMAELRARLSYIDQHRPFARSTEILSPPALPVSPSRPNGKMVWVLAAFAGLFAGVTSAFVAQFIQGGSRRPMAEPA